MLKMSQKFAGLTVKVVTAFVVLVLLGACKSSTVIDEYRETPKARIIGSDDTVVVLGRRHRSTQETEVDFISCVGSTLGQGVGAISVIPEQEFVDSMYPHFETSTMPMNVKNLGRMVRNPFIAQKFSDFRIRYFVWVEGFTERTDSSGSVTCAVGPGGGGCFGYASWDDEANYEASIWDFENLELSGRISAETKGTSYMPAVVIPIPLLARVQASACKSMADQIKSFLQ